jgi:hypothetical protein
MQKLNDLSRSLHPPRTRQHADRAPFTFIFAMPAYLVIGVALIVMRRPCAVEWGWRGPERPKIRGKEEYARKSSWAGDLPSTAG